VGAAATQPRHITSPQDDIYVGCSTAKVGFIFAPDPHPEPCGSVDPDGYGSGLRNGKIKMTHRKKADVLFGKWRLLLDFGNPNKDTISH
jgi:hypothetical protein